MTEMKQCRTCKEFKPATVEYFYANRNNNKNYLAPDCKICQLAKRKISPTKQVSGHKKQIKTGWIYFIQGKKTELIKIGYTQHIGKRIGAMQPSSPDALIVIGIMQGTIYDEVELHRRFATFRQHYEWFSPVSEIMTYIHQNTHQCVITSYKTDNGGLRYQYTIMERLL